MFLNQVLCCGWRRRKYFLISGRTTGLIYPLQRKICFNHYDYTTSIKKNTASRVMKLANCVKLFLLDKIYQIQVIAEGA